MNKPKDLQSIQDKYKNKKLQRDAYGPKGPSAYERKQVSHGEIPHGPAEPKGVGRYGRVSGGGQK